ncbi:UNVERIFIED_CONTAM: hypothetical protein H355_008772 [Colinus virginianus]|nr:hypothetical protein H355_008772 [Colinus virginianus]
MLSSCFLDLGFKVVGQSGQSGACVMKRASSIAAVTVRCTVQTLLSALETARNTKIACTTKFLVLILPASSIDESTNCGGFSLIHLIATGVSCFFGSSLLTFVIYVYCQRCQKQSQESTVIHPTTPNHLHYKGNTTPKNEKYTPMEFKL